jgi:hypothetical protein
VYARVQAPSGYDGYGHLFASSLDPLPSRLRLAVRSSTAQRPVTFAVALSTTGIVHLEVTVDGLQVGSGQASTHPGEIAVGAFRSPFSGSLTAFYNGTPSRLPTRASQHFTVASRMHLALNGSYRTAHGVKLFHDVGQVHLIASVLPAIPGRRVTVQIQTRHDGRWRTVGSTTEKLAAKPTRVHLDPTLGTNTLTRIKVVFRGDVLNTASRATSPTFEID